MLKRINIIVCSLFYVGYIPFAPGTIASIIAFIFFRYIPLDTIFKFSIFLLFSLITIKISGSAEKLFKNKDDKKIVIDEFIGAGFAVAFLPYSIVSFLLAFAFFRIFDIMKPSIIKKVQYMNGGLGIVLDDVISGIAANLCTQIIIRFIL